jgi:outer membrane protein
MNRNVLLISAIAAGIAAPALAQTAAPQPAAPAAAPQQVKPEAVPAKIALIAFEQVVLATNEGQQAVATVQKKYEPTKAKIEAAGGEVDSLKKQLQSGTSLSDEEKASRARTIDTKEKQLNRDAEDAQAAYNQDLQEAISKIAGKVSQVAQQYVSKNGYTLLIDIGSQQSNVMWATPNTDISQAVVDAYNTQSGVAAPPPSAPSATKPATPRPSTTPTTPRPSTTPKK